MHKFVENLLNGEKVEFKALGEVAELYGGLTGKSKTDFEKGSAKYIPYKNVFNNLEVDFNHLESVEVLENEKQHFVKYGDILFTASSETLEEVGISSAITKHTDEKIYLNSFCFGVRFKYEIKLTPEFAKYLFRIHFIRNQIIKTANGTTRFNISKERFKKIKIPLPPLSAQKRIVEILDKFTNLTAELTLRKKQFQYYRDFLLSENNLKKSGFQWKKLGEVFDIIAGGDVPKDAFSEIKTNEYVVPILSNGIDDKSLYGYTNKPKIIKPSLTVSARGTIGWTSFRNEPFFPIVRLLVLTPKINLNLRYSYYYMKTIENKYKIPKTGIPQLTKPMIKDIKIPLPPLEKQLEIVEILDKFDKLTNSISEGLPKEIELREKQYRYYRDLLLDFN